MRPPAFAAVLLVLGACAPAHAVSETAEDFAAAMQGCWNRANVRNAETDNALSNQMCLDGGVEGALTLLECHTHGDLTECATQDGLYAFGKDKFSRGVDGLWDSCDVLLGPGKQLTLKNCVSIDPAAAVEIEDTVYERAVGQ